MKISTTSAMLMIGLLAANHLHAASIMQVQVNPADPTISENVQLATDLFYPSGGFSVSDFSVTPQGSNTFEIDIFVDSPAPGDLVPAIIGSETVNASLGLLDAGDYGYTINLFETPRLTTVPLFQEAQPGSFTISVPEPTTATIFCLTSSILCMTTRRRTA